MTPTKLSVNINKIATLRNSRGGLLPSVTEAAMRAQQYGAQGITVHPRPDERHIRYADVFELKPLVTTEFNVEGYPSEDFMRLVLDVVPTQVTLVPDPPGVLTSNAGWNTIAYSAFLSSIIGRLKEKGIRTSIFVDPVGEMVEGAKATGTDRIELYTESYAEGYAQDRDLAIAPFIAAAKKANELRIGLNAGHDLNLENLAFFKQSVPGLLEVSIGHALIADALYVGLSNAVRMYLHRLT
ncbi:MAG: pyridoxine 5'-phosphate synthase [Flavobacteriales bacterium]|nr:pyridoxine 5'-phosphate synthase [Flavobacteriales bacterium]